MTIILADSHTMVRQGLAALLRDIPGFQIIGEAADGLEAVELVEGLHPDVLIVEAIMPGLSGPEVARRVRQLSPATQVVMLSISANEAYVREALRSGAAGYVLKHGPVADLVAALREVAAGRRYLSPPLSERAIDDDTSRAPSAAMDAYDTLTAREREVLQLAAEGASSPEIAARLSISPRTAEAHRARVMQKLGLRTQTDLIRYALRRGLLPMD